MIDSEMAQIKDFQMTEPLKKVTKNKANQTSGKIHMYLPIKYDLRTTQKLVTGRNILGSSHENYYFGVVKINNVSKDFSLEISTP